MRQLEYVQILYAFHFDSLPKNEHETRARFLPRSSEFPKRRNERVIYLLPALPNDLNGNSQSFSNSHA